MAGPGLRTRREDAGLSLRVLAGRSGYSKSYLSRVENGRRSPPTAVLRLYAALPALDADRPATRVSRSSQRAAAPDGPRLEHAWFGAEVRRLRLAAGKSLNTLGAEVFLSRSQLGKIEQGEARGDCDLARRLDQALETHGRLAALYAAERARIGPVAPDTDILNHSGGGVAGRGADRAETAATAAAVLQALRIRSHQAGPLSILDELGEGIVDLHTVAGAAARGGQGPVWTVTLHYAELLGWSAQEIGNDAIALRWTHRVAKWARALDDADALGYALVRLSQQARRRGDAAQASHLAGQAAAVHGISPRVARFAAQREAQACALAKDEPAFHRAVDRYHALPADTPPAPTAPPAATWGPVPDPVFEQSRLFEATCLVDLGDFRTAAKLFDQDMARLEAPRTGYARLAVRQAIASAQVGEPERACEIVYGVMGTVARQGSASLRSDLKLLNRTLNRYRSSPAVLELLPDLAALTRAAGATPSAGACGPGRTGHRGQP